MNRDKRTIGFVVAVVVAVVAIEGAVIGYFVTDSALGTDSGGSEQSAGQATATTSMTVGPGPGGSTSTQNAGPAGGHSPNGDEVQPSQAPGDDPGSASAQDVAQRVATIVMSWQPAVDASRGAAVPRAAQWLTGQALAEAKAYTGAPAGLRPDQLWTVWRSQKAVITATPAEVKTVSESGSSAQVDVALRQVAIADYVPASVAGVWTVTCEVQKTASGWKVSKYTLKEGA